MALTLFVQLRTVDSVKVHGPENFQRSMLIAYQPDPFYPLDKKIAQAVTQEFVGREWRVVVATHGSANFPSTDKFDLIVVIANTYNWRPDWKTTSWISKSDFKNKRVVAFTLGAGSTEWAQLALEQAIADSGADLITSKTYWLLRPNDENKLDQKNSQVAVDLAVQEINRLSL